MAKGSRWWRHIATDSQSLRRVFTQEALARIERAIAGSEALHGGQVVFAVEAALALPRVHRNLTPRERALEVFGLLRVWDTEDNNGVLIYLLLADRDVEIVADRGLADAASEAQWKAICTDIERACAEGRHVDGVVKGIEESAAVIARRWPHVEGGARNELPNRPVVL